MSVEEATDLVTIDASGPRRATLRGIAIRTPLVPFGRPRAGASSRPSPSSRSARSRSAAPMWPSPSLTADERARGVITYSSGNHAQGVARAARLLGAPAVVVMPSDAPALKSARVEADGAEVVVVGTAERGAPAGRGGDRRRARPRDHPARSTTTGSSPARARSGWRSPRTCPTSPRSSCRSAAAGWPAGSRSRSGRSCPSARLIGVEPELAADARDSLRAGRIVALAGGRRVADDRRRDADARRSAGAPSPTCRGSSTTS